MHEMIKRRKDEGFTLIELMIVIAVIGILAVVLVPKVGTIKTQAKSAGIDTNIRMVQAYGQSRITSWANAGTSVSTIEADFQSALTGGTDLMANPFSRSTTVIPDSVTPAQPAVFTTTNVNYGTDGQTRPVLAGTVIIIPTSASSISIYGVDSAGKVMADKTITITP
ncbi:MAG TPA: prepilin-type N-terminal cleavage/methylation domain-containing protein [Desulfosporosinus sp.]